MRSDLTELARQGLVARVRGGVRALQQGQSEVGFDLRLRLEVERKQAIARAAAALVGEGEAVALDASTTAYYLALELRTKRELVVVTNGLLVATALADAPGITVLVTGGMLRLSAMSLVGDLGTDVLRTTRINKGFLGARGLSLERGLMDLNPDEVRIKQEMADACEQVYGILDRTKWHRSALLSFVPLDRLTGIVTDSGAPEDEVEAWRAAGVERDHRRPRAARGAAGAAPRSAAGRPQRRAGRLMPRLAAVDLGAQSGRVAVGTLRRRAAHGRRGAPVRERARDAGRRPALGLRAPLPRHPRRPRRRRARVDSVAVDSWAVDFGLVDADGRLLASPVHYRDGRRAAAVERVLRTRPAARALRADRHPAAADQHRLRAGRDGRRERPGARRPRTRSC